MRGCWAPTSVFSPTSMCSPSTSKLSPLGPSPHASLPGNIVDFSSLTRLKYSIKLTDFSGCLTICVEDSGVYVDPVLIAVVWLCFVLLLCQLTVENSIKSAPKCTVPKGKIQKIFWRGAVPPPQKFFWILLLGMVHFGALFTLFSTVNWHNNNTKHSQTTAIKTGSTYTP